MNPRREILIVLGCFALAPLVALVAPGSPQIVLHHAQQLLHLELSLGFQDETDLVSLVSRYDSAESFLKLYYAVAHVSALIALFLWTYARRPLAYTAVRNGFVLTQVCVVFCYLSYPTAPPAFLDDLRGGVDPLAGEGTLLHLAHFLQYPYAAFPSGHVAFAAVVCLSLFKIGTARLKALGLAHLLITTIAVIATNNHYWVDAMVGFFIASISCASQLLRQTSSQPDAE